MITLDDVKYWHISQGISHIVCGIKSGWIHCACGLVVVANASEEDLDKKPSKRICKKCRAKLADLTKVKKE